MVQPPEMVAEWRREIRNAAAIANVAASTIRNSRADLMAPA
jgi:hypothetical protein